jgi:hypothetical protein
MITCHLFDAASASGSSANNRSTANCSNSRTPLRLHWADGSLMTSSNGDMQDQTLTVMNRTAGKSYRRARAMLGVQNVCFGHDSDGAVGHGRS